MLVREQVNSVDAELMVASGGVVFSLIVMLALLVQPLPELVAVTVYVPADVTVSGLVPVPPPADQP